jgi:hypothetical protein
MALKRTKKRNKLTPDADLAVLAYALHVAARHISKTLCEVNIPSAYRAKLGRKAQSLTIEAQSLSDHLRIPQQSLFISKDSTEKVCEQFILSCLA